MNIVKKFLSSETSVGISLAITTLVAILLKNSPWQSFYDDLISYRLNFSIFTFYINQQIVNFVNDFLMSLFFLAIGLELKKEVLVGYLKVWKDCLLPAIAALGGIICPALIYTSFTHGNSEALRGWAIPSATDIAFATGVLSLLGNIVPRALKVCLLSLAIFDDIAAILIIATFYASKISAFWLCSSFVPLFILAFLNYKNVNNIILYGTLGIILWGCILSSGIHPTISGVLLASFIPLKTSLSSTSPLEKLEAYLYPWVSFIILPIFAFLNMGISVRELSLSIVSHPIVLGIATGLFLGKQGGVLLFTYIIVKLKICNLPANTSITQFYGMAIVTGIGFTMSLFIGSLAFSQPEHQNLVKFGVIVGSSLSAVLGYLTLSYTSTRKEVL